MSCSVKEIINEDFDVILPVHGKVDPMDLSRSIASVASQTVKPKTIIISIDGPINSSLKEVINSFNHLENIKHISSDENLGAGHARALAIKHSYSPLVALMDSDDISRKDRFEIQLNFINECRADVVGGMITEFYKTPGDINRQRLVPLKHNHIKASLKWKQSMNNVTLMFRRDVYNRVKGYRSIPYFEDYDLIVRMMMSGAKFENQTNVLVQVKTDDTFMHKRRGWDYIVQEQKHFLRMYRWKFISIREYIIAASARLVARIMPMFILKYYYKLSRN